MRARRLAGSALVLGALVLGACGGGDSGSDSSSATTAKPAGDGDGGGPGGDAAATVLLQPATFKPEDVTIKVGETVHWKWGGGVQHDVQGEGFDSGIKSKGSFDHTFDTAGTFPFKCNVHPTTMKGTVTVEG